MEKELLGILQKKLLSWYEKHGRKTLAWRNLQSKQCDEKLRNIDRAYGVYISEIMLQQTRVQYVLDRFYFPFLEKFPNLRSLANASEDELFKAWQGLGYYSRARNLKKAALECMLKFNGSLPKNVEDLRSLSGIGPYTAAAIACFAYNQKLHFVDTNIARVLWRLFALKNPSMKDLQERAKQFLNLDHAFEHNQALLDLGALVCLSKNPKCNLCPFYDFCQAKFDIKAYTKSKKISYEKRTLHLLLLEFKQKFAIEKSQTKLYRGMYNFPLLKQCEQKKYENMVFLSELKHSYTKYKLNIKVYHKSLEEEDKNYEFKNLKELESIALSTLSLKALKLIKN